MNLIDSLSNIGKTQILPLNNGYAEKIKDIWDDIVAPKLIEIDKIKKMYLVLKQYVEDNEAVFAIRTGNSVNNIEGSKALRRGFLTTFKNSKIRYFYTDNDFATIIYKLIYDGNWNPNYKEFKNIMISGEFPVHFNSFSKNEIKKAAYPIKWKSPKIGDAGYKVSHIFDAGQNYLINSKVCGMSELCKSYFPLGRYDDWKLDTYSGKYTRVSDVDLTDESLKFLKAHFLRFACPLNYILTPKTGINSCQTAKIKLYKNDIGESKELLDYAVSIFQEKYGMIYKEYTDKLLLTPYSNNNSAGDTFIGLTYGLGVGAKTISVSSKTISTKLPAKSRTDREIILFPPDKDLFKKKLLKNKQIKYTYYYDDGKTYTGIWKSDKFSSASNLMNNICSRIGHRADKDHIIKAVFEV